MAMYVQQSQEPNKELKRQLKEPPSISSGAEADDELSSSQSSEYFLSTEQNQQYNDQSNEVSEGQLDPNEIFKSNLEKFKEYMISIQAFVNRRNETYINKDIIEVTSKHIQEILNAIEAILGEINNRYFVPDVCYYSYVTLRESITMTITRFYNEISNEILHIDNILKEITEISKGKLVSDDRLAYSINIVDNLKNEYEIAKKLSKVVQSVSSVYNVFQLFNIVPEDKNYFKGKKDSIIWECIYHPNRVHKVQK